MAGTTNIPLPSGAYLDNCRWIQDHLADLTHDFPDQWVAVDDGRVLAVGPDLGQVTHEVGPDAASPDVVFQFIASGSLIL